MKKGGMVLGVVLVLALSFTVPSLSLASSKGLFKLKWKKKVGRNWRPHNPLIFEKYILHASDRGLYLFDQKGTLLWSFKENEYMSGVVASPDFIVVSGYKGYVYALSWDGEKIWEFETGGAVYFTSLGDLDGDESLEVVVGSEDSHIYALSGRDGRLLWKFKTGGDVDSSPALGDLDGDGDLDVVVGSGDGYVYALSGRDGRLLWKFKTAGNLESSPALGDLDGDGNLEVVVGSEDYHIYALSGRGGKLLWKFKTNGWVISSPALGDLDGDGYLEVVVGSIDDHIVASIDDRIYALSGRDGRLLWKLKTEDEVCSSPALGDLDGDGSLEVVVGSDDNYIYALSGKDGRLLWKFETGSDVLSSPALGDLDGDGYLDLAVASRVGYPRDGYLYVFEATVKGGEVVWSRFHGDSAGTGLYENAVSFAKFNLSKRAFAWHPHKEIPHRRITLASKPPYLEITSVKLYDEDMDKLFEAGEKGKLIVKIANTGKGTAYNLKLKASSPFFKKTIHIKKLEPNKTITKEITFRVPIRVKTQKVYANIELDAGKYSPEPVKVAFTTKAPVPPSFRIAYKVDDDRVGESIGNANGIIEPRETIELLITVKNPGKGEAKDVKVKLVSKEVDIIKGTAEIGNLPPAASASGKLVFFVPANLKEEEIKFDLKIEEDLGIFTTSTKLALKVRKGGGRVYDYAAAYREENYSYSSPSLEVEAPQAIISGTSGGCVRPNPNYYFFGVVVYDYMEDYMEISDLSYVKNDKELMDKLATCYMGVPKENIKFLENPSYASLKKHLKKFATHIKKKDALLYFYYSGHGIVDSNNKFYILPTDASIEDEEVLKESGIDVDELKRLLARARGKKVAFIDACRIKPQWKPAVVVSKPELIDMALIFSTKEGQISNVDKEDRYSAFTRALYEMATSGLFNVDADDDGYVEIKELMGPLTKWLRRVSADSRQTPDAWGPHDFEVFPVD